MSAFNRYFILVGSAIAALYFVMKGQIDLLPWAVTCFVLKLHVNELSDELKSVRGLAEKGKQ